MCVCTGMYSTFLLVSSHDGAIDVRERSVRGEDHSGSGFDFIDKNTKRARKQTQKR